MCFNRSVVHLRQALGDRKADAQAACGMLMRAIGLGEQFEDPLAHVRWDTYAGVANAHQGMSAVTTNIQANSPSLRRVPIRIVEDVGQDLHQSSTVPIHVQYVAVKRERQILLLRREGRLESVDCGTDQRFELQQLFLQANRATRNASDIQQIVNEVRHVMHLSLHDLTGHAQIRVRVFGLLENLSGSADRGKRITQLVRESREELILAPISLAQETFGLVSPGDIACDLGGAHNLPVFIPDR
jgi:hypothetical protein